MEQLGLRLDPPRARRRDPATSQEAAERVREFEGEHYRLILEALAVAPGSIYAIAARSRLSHVQVARRLGEMEGQRVKQTGRTVLGPTGRKCREWTLA